MSEDCFCSSRRLLICEVSFSRVERASWMQSSRFDKRIKASKEDVGCSPCDCLDVCKVARTGPSVGRSVKLV